MIDYKEFVTSDKIDLVKYHSKFALVEKYHNQELDITELDFFDPTIFAYLFFRINGVPLKLYSYQDIVLNDSHRYLYVRTGRQMGKSIALDVSAAHNLCLDHGHGFNQCIISANLAQAQFQMRRVKDLLNTAKFNWEESKGSTDNTQIVTVDMFDKEDKKLYTNMLVVVPCSEAARGYDFHQVNLDEFEYWQDVDMHYLYNSVIEPTTFATKGKVRIFSTPNGMDSYGAELERLALPTGEKKFHTYVFSFYDKPDVTDKEIEFLKAGKTRQEYESEILAIRSISDRNYFTVDEIERSYDAKLREIDMIGKQPFAFLDVGAKHDRSFFGMGYVEYEHEEDDDDLPHIYIPIMHGYPIGYPLSRVVGSFSNEQDSDGWHYEKSVREYMEEWSQNGIIPVLGVDVTGNSGISPLLESVGISAVDTVFSGPAKSGFYQRYKWYMEKGLLHRPKNDIFDYEARHLEVQKSKRGYLQIHHASEEDRDDSQDMVAGLINLCDPLNEIVPSLRFF